MTKEELYKQLNELFEEEKILSEEESSKEAEENKLTVFNASNEENINFKKLDLNNSKEIGIHCGSEKASKSLGYKHLYKLILSNYNIFECDFDVESIWSSLELVNKLNIPDEDKDKLRDELKSKSGDENKYLEYSKIYRKYFLDNGYNLISYVNNIEDEGSISYIILDTKIIEKQDLVESLQEDATDTIDVNIEKPIIKDKNIVVNSEEEWEDWD